MPDPYPTADLAALRATGKINQSTVEAAHATLDAAVAAWVLAGQRTADATQLAAVVAARAALDVARNAIADRVASSVQTLLEHPDYQPVTPRQMHVDIAREIALALMVDSTVPDPV